MSDKPAPKKTGRPPKPRLKLVEVAAALAELQGNIAAVARRFDVHRSSLQEFIGKSTELQKVLQDARDGMVDNAESALYRAVIGGEAWAVCFFLKTQGKARGYIERSEVTGMDGAPIPIQVYIPANGRD
jgi:hypothetical protein